MATMTQFSIGGFHEQSANGVIAAWLNDAGRDWEASAERTHTLIGSNARPDIIIRQGDRMPVIVECEYGSPAVSDATGRLGHTLIGETRSFTEVIAVGISEDCQDDTPQGFRQRLDGNESGVHRPTGHGEGRRVAVGTAPGYAGGLGRLLRIRPSTAGCH